MQNIKLIRKRFIPYEVKDISGDEVLYLDDDLLVTKWKSIYPREDIKGGVSYAYFKDGWKISKVYDHYDNLVYYYCDIIEVEIDKENNTYTGVDLLIDIKVYADRRLEVVDLDELVQAREEGLITEAQMLDALRKADKLLRVIYEGKFTELVGRW